MIRTTRRAFLASCGVRIAPLDRLRWDRIRAASCISARLQAAAEQDARGGNRNASLHLDTTSASSKGVASLLDQNKDAAGWLVVENTAVSYPLVQASPKNKDWYLHHNFWNQKRRSRVPFH